MSNQKINKYKDFAVDLRDGSVFSKDLTIKPEGYVIDDVFYNNLCSNDRVSKQFNTLKEAKDFAIPIQQKNAIRSKIQGDGLIGNSFIESTIRLLSNAVEDNGTSLQKSKLELIERDLFACNDKWVVNKKFLFREDTWKWIQELKGLLNDEDRIIIDKNVEIVNDIDITLPIAVLDVDNKYHAKMGYDPANPDDVSPEQLPPSWTPAPHNKIIEAEGIIFFKGTPDEVSIRMNAVDNKIYVWKGAKLKYVLAQGRRNRVADDIVDVVKGGK